MTLKKVRCRSGYAGTVTSLLVCVIAVAGLLLASACSHAASYNLVSGNSSVFIDPSSPAGMNGWVVDGINQLAEQWWFYRIGETNQASIDTLAAPVASQLSANVLNVSYVGQYVDVILRYTLTGGPAGSGNSTIAESLRIRNKTTAAMAFHLFEYTDLNLDNTPNDDTAALLNPTTIGQWDGALISTETASVGGTTPLPNRWEITNAADLLNKLNTTPVLNLADAVTPFFGDAAFSFQWDMNIPAGGTQLLSKSKILARGGAIGDTVWLDSNGDGIQDVGEPGIQGVTVNLAADFNGDGIIDYTDSTVTDVNGYYLFPNLPGGKYTITVDTSTLPAGAIQTYDLDGLATPNTATITLNTGEVSLNVDFGYWQLASIGDFVWNDLNGNGIQDAGEPGIPGVKVNLYAADGVTLLATTLTDANGKYLFSNLTPGGYVVEFVNPGGYTFSPQDQGSDDTKDSDANPTTGKTAVVTLASGENNTTIDAGLYKLASIGDFVWQDTNGNGIQDAGEPGIPGVTVNLYAADGTTLLATATTDANGMYLFSGLTPGQYVVGFVSPGGYAFSPQDQGLDDTIDSDANPITGKTAVVMLASGENNTTIDAGLVPAIPPECTLSITSNFNGTKIPGGDYVWFNSVGKVTNRGSGMVSVSLDNSKITFSSGVTNYVVAMPPSTIIFDPAATSASTVFVAGRWVTTVPATYSGNVFLGGVPYLVPAGGLPGGIKNVVWSSDFTTNKAGVALSWQWAAAVFTTFTGDPAAVGAKPIDGGQLNPYNNSDHAGSPENYRKFAIGGARGGGAANITGSYSGTGHGQPCPVP